MEQWYLKPKYLCTCVREMKTIKYLSFIPETRDVANKSLPVEWHTSTCGNRQETTNIRTQDTVKPEFCDHPNVTQMWSLMTGGR